MNNFYGLGLFEKLYKDPFKYRGGGRPRKKDYSTFNKLQSKLNQIMSYLIDMKKYE